MARYRPTKTIGLEPQTTNPSVGDDPPVMIQGLEETFRRLTLDLRRPASRAHSLGRRSVMTDYSESIVPPGFYAGSSQPSSPTQQTQELPSTANQVLPNKLLAGALPGSRRRQITRNIHPGAPILEEDTPSESEEEEGDMYARDISYRPLIDYQVAIVIDIPVMEEERSESLNYEIASLINRLWDTGSRSLYAYTTRGLDSRITDRVENWSIFQASANFAAISLKETISKALERYVTALDAASEILVTSVNVDFKSLLVLVLADADRIGPSTEFADFFVSLIQQQDHIQKTLPARPTALPQITMQFAPLKDPPYGDNVFTELGESLIGSNLERTVRINTIPAESVGYSEFLERCIMQQILSHSRGYGGKWQLPSK